jgi:hypothetical protein
MGAVRKFRLAIAFNGYTVLDRNLITHRNQESFIRQIFRYIVPTRVNAMPEVKAMITSVAR